MFLLEVYILNFTLMSCYLFWQHLNHVWGVFHKLVLRRSLECNWNSEALKRFLWCFSKTTSVKFRWLAWSVPVFLLWLHSVLVNLLNYSVRVKLACLATRLVPHLRPIWKQESNSDLSVLISIFFLEFSVILHSLWCFKEHCQRSRGSWHILFKALSSAAASKESM